MNASETLDASIAIPSAPRVVALLMAELVADEPQLARLNALFGSDPGLAALLLRAANSHSVAMRHRVLGLPQALALLSVAQLRLVVTSAQVGTPGRSVPGLDLHAFWRYSQITARLARSLAGILHLDSVTAYAAGLLHAVGEVVIHRAEADRIHRINALCAPFDLGRMEMERGIFGFSYAQVSAGLARRWSLPQVVVETMCYQARPLDNDSYEPLAAVLHLAVWRARAAQARLNDRELAVTYPGEVGMVLGLDIDTVLQQAPINWKPDFGNA